MYFTDKAYAIDTCYSSNNYVDLSKESKGLALVKHLKKQKKKTIITNYSNLIVNTILL